MSRRDLDAAVRAVQASLSDDPRRPGCRRRGPVACHCYVASEALYHMLGGEAAGWTPMNVRHEGDSHWFLRRDDGLVVDPTEEQFERPVPVHRARGKGFLTKGPSKRARIVIKRAKESMMTPNRRDRIPGGLAAGRSPSEFDPEQLRAGTEVELEHTPDPEVAQEIAMDHLAEHADYYKALARMEKALEGKKKKRLVSRALVINDKGLVLSVVQKGNPGNLLLPGGGVEPGETVAEAAARELLEETGLKATSLEPLVVVQSPKRDTVYFLAEVTGRRRGSSEGPTRWSHPRELVESKHGEHHRQVFDAVGVPY